jgi:arylsulfatase A-like enzyme
MRARTSAMVEMIDTAIGNMLSTLDETGLRDETLIVFTSDHGDGLGDHGIMGKGPWGYRSIIETPLLIAGPHVRQGVSEAVISDVDLAPSMVQALGLDPLPFVDGLDISGHWLDAQVPTRDWALIDYRNGFADSDYACAGLVSAHKTYLRYQDGVEELTDLSADPQEHVNIAAKDPAQCAVWRAHLLDALLTTQNRGPAQLSHA